MAELPVDPVKIGKFVTECGFTGAYDFDFETVRTVLGKSGNASTLNWALAMDKNAYPETSHIVAQIDAYEDPAFMDVAAEP